MLLHKGSFAVVHSADIVVLLWLALVATNAVGKPETAIVMDRVDRVGERAGETREVHAECVSFEEENVVGIDLADGRDDSVVEGQQTSPLLICGLVHGIETSDPRITFVPPSENLPKVDHSVLKVLVVPEGRVAGRVVAMPILVLATRARMEVQNGVDAVLGANVDYAIQMLEAFFFDVERVHVVFEVAVVEREAQAVEAKRSHKLGVLFCEEVLEKLVEEEVILLLTKNFQQSSANLTFATGEPIDEVLHHHPASQRCLPETELLAPVAHYQGRRLNCDRKLTPRR